MTTLTEFRQMEADRAAEQVWINEVFERSGADVASAVIRISAALAHAEYPQYHMHWAGDDWTLARVTQRIETKGGLRFDVGDIVLLQYVPGYFGGDAEKTAYSVRGRIDVRVDYGVEPLEGWAAFFARSPR